MKINLSTDLEKRLIIILTKVELTIEQFCIDAIDSYIKRMEDALYDAAHPGETEVTIL